VPRHRAPTRRASPAVRRPALDGRARASSRRLLYPRQCAARGPHLPMLASAQDASSRVAAPPYVRRARGGPPVCSRRRPYVRRSRRRSTADASHHHPAVTPSCTYKRASSSPPSHACPSRQLRHAAPLQPPPERRLLRSSPFQPAPLASSLGPSAPPGSRIVHPEPSTRRRPRRRGHRRRSPSNSRAGDTLALTPATSRS
jgi:hypothetical protein